MPHKGPSSSPTEGAVGQELQPAAEPATGLQQPLASRNPPTQVWLCCALREPHHIILIHAILF